MTEPRTEAGKRLAVPRTWPDGKHTVACRAVRAEAVRRGPCDCGLLDAILAIEAEAIRGVVHGSPHTHEADGSIRWLRAEFAALDREWLREALHRDPAVCGNKPHARWKLLSKCDHIAARLTERPSAADLMAMSREDFDAFVKATGIRTTPEPT